jgi:hypothetical protein
MRLQWQTIIPKIPEKPRQTDPTAHCPKAQNVSVPQMNLQTKPGMSSFCSER